MASVRRTRPVASPRLALGVAAASRDEFERVCDRIAAHFSRVEAKENVRAYLAGLLANIQRRNGWQLAKVVGAANPYAIQHILGRSVWDVNAVRDDLRRFIAENLTDGEFILRFGELGFPKRGNQSAGVQRQFNWSSKRIENCQVGLVLGCVTTRFCALVDRELYMPQEWIRDLPRRRKACVPEGLKYSGKPQLARDMIARALDAGMVPSWVISEHRRCSDVWTCHMLRDRRQPYVLAMDASQCSHLMKQLGPATALPARSATDPLGSVWRAGSHWTELFRVNDGDFVRVILLRSHDKAPGQFTHYAAYAPPTATLAELVAVVADREVADSSLMIAKSEVGLDQYEVRSWHGWYRHVTLVLWAHAFLVVNGSSENRRLLESVLTSDTRHLRAKAT